jgi:flagellar protein FlgJ
MTLIKPLGPTLDSAVKNSTTKTPLTKNPQEAAKQFEALLVKEMLESMWSTVPKGGMLSGSNEESLYRDMFNEALANSISEGKGIGVKDVILKDFKRLNK